MKVFKLNKKLLAYLRVFRKNQTIGFVPTMGALHSGHLKLITTSKKKCDITICSIFINPKQFDNTNDFSRYPKTLNSDLEKLKKVNCDIVYTPEVNDLYEKDEKVKEFDFGKLASIMEGKFRIGHFNGMATIVEKFFRLIKPTKAFFGQKDLQQLQIVKSLVKQMNIAIEIIGIPTVREKNGLAKSSRNKLLSEDEKNKSKLIYNCLKYCIKNKEKGITELKLFIENKFKEENNVTLEYVEFVNLNTLLPIKKWEKENAICIAAYINSVRLIDNIIL